MIGPDEKENKEPAHFNAPLREAEVQEDRTIILVPVEGASTNTAHMALLTAEEKLDLECLSPMLQEAKDLLLGLQVKLLLLDLDEGSRGVTRAQVLAEIEAEDRKIQALIRDHNMGPTFSGVTTLEEFVNRIEARLTEIIRKQYGENPTVRVVL